MKKQDVVSGTLLIALSVLLYTQTVAPSDAVIFEDDIDPMKYPRLLVLTLGLLGVVLAGKGLMLRDAEQGIPVFSLRTLGVMAVLLVYAAIFTTAGFFLSSFIAGVAVAFIMGWHRFPILAVSFVLSLAVIWLLFTYVLRIPLPAGTLF